MTDTPAHTVVIICGPTAVGKTAAGVALAQHYQTSVISADSRQCFRELEIGVARPSPEELRSVHHYFIASHSIGQEVNAVVFEQYALHAADTIFKESPLAVMVGGTGLYIKTFCDGLDDMPAIPDAIRKQVTYSYEQNGIDWLQRELQEKDPAFWQTAEQQNPKRLMRALEILHATGQSITAFRTNRQLERPFRIVKIGMELPKELLYERINRRVDDMLQAGLLQEVQRVRSHRRLNALQTVGYRELFDYLDGSLTWEQATARIKQNTRRYAKRQMTWFKRDPSIRWLDARDATVDAMQRIIDEPGVS